MGLIPPSSTHPLLVFGVYDDLSIHVWDVFSGKELYVLSGHSETPEFGMDLVQGLRPRMEPVLPPMVTMDRCPLGYGNRQETVTIQCPFDGCCSAAFNPDGTRLAIWGFDNTIKVWDLTSPEPSLDFTIDHENAQSFLLYSPNGTRLAAGGVDGLVRVWDAQTGDLQLALAGHSGVSWLNSFSLDGKRLYTSSTDHSIKEWDLTPGRSC